MYMAPADVTNTANAISDLYDALRAKGFNSAGAMELVKAYLMGGAE